MADNSNQIRRHITATGKELELFVLRLEKILKGKARKLLGEVLSGDEFTAGKARDAIAVIAQLDQVLSDSQVQDQIGELRQIYGKELSAIKDVYFQGVKAGEQFYSGIDADIVETLITYDASAITNTLTQYVDDVRGTLTRAVLTGEVPNFEDLHDANFSAGQLQTEVQTMFSSFSRTVVAKKAKDVGFDTFEYIGPLDDLTRDFCREVLDGEAPGDDIEPRSEPIYTAEEISRMDNGQTGDVMADCGGYNCRHQWNPVESAEETDEDDE